MKNIESILKTFVLFDIVKDLIENSLYMALNDRKLKTITINYEGNDKGITIKKENVSLFKLVNDRNIIELKFADSKLKWQSFNLNNIKSITEGKKNILWDCENMPIIEVIEMLPNKKLANTDFDKCYYAMVNGVVANEYKGIGVKDGEYMFLHYVPSNLIEYPSNDKINDLKVEENKNNTEVENMNSNFPYIIEDNEGNQFTFKNMYSRDTAEYRGQGGSKVVFVNELDYYKIIQELNAEETKVNNYKYISAYHNGYELRRQNDLYILTQYNYNNIIISGTKDEVIAELKRWSIEVDSKNSFMLEMENHFINVLESMEEDIKVTDVSNWDNIDEDAELEKAFNSNEYKNKMEDIKNNTMKYLNFRELEIIEDTPINNKLCTDYTKDELLKIANENKINVDATASREYIFISIYNWITEGDETQGEYYHIITNLGEYIGSTNEDEEINKLYNNIINDSDFKNIQDFRTCENKLDVKINNEWIYSICELCHEKNIEILKNMLLDKLNESKLQMNLQALATPDPQIENWNNKLSTPQAIQKQLDVLKRIIIKRKADNNGLDLIPCNGFIISKLLQVQGVNVQYNRYNYTKCYYSIKKSTPEVVVVALKDNDNKLHYYTIDTTLEVNQDNNINMNLQLLATKQLKPIFNEDIKGHKEYQLQHLEIYNSNVLNFNKKRINNKMIEEYTKYFVYKDNTFMSVPPAKEGNYPGSYYEHVRNYNYKIDPLNKVILFTDKEV